MIDGQELGENSQEKIQRVAKLNAAFKEDKEAWSVLKDLRQIEKPILLDFNNVLATSREPLAPNPDGNRLIHELQKVGDVIIATTARSWEAVNDFLTKNGMWNDEIILMASSNWKFLADENPLYKDKKDKIMAEFGATLSKRGIDFTEYHYSSAPAKKPLSPLFNKPFDIPLIDDLPMATLYPYPGMLGIRTIPFFDEEEKISIRNTANMGNTFDEAINQVRDHYANNSTNRIAS